VAGIEAAPKFQRYASAKLGLPVQLGTIESLRQRFDSEFDVIFMRDVLEHLYDPIRALHHLRSLLAPDGVIVIETMNIGSAAARFYGLTWRQIVCSHTFYWTKQSLEMAVDAAGLQPVYWSDPRYWDPDRRREQRNRIREILKLVARIILVFGYVRPANRLSLWRTLPERLTGGRVSEAALRFKVGDQPVLGDVLLCIAMARR
jgi:SAM-dependent methyltransferase